MIPRPLLGILMTVKREEEVFEWCGSKKGEIWGSKAVKASSKSVMTDMALVFVFLKIDSSSNGLVLLVELARALN